MFIRPGSINVIEGGNTCIAANLMFFKSLDLTTALRPLLLPDETLLFVQDAVGLYKGCVVVSHP